MHVSDIRIDPVAGGAHLSARIDWEDRQQTPFDLDIETGNAGAMAPDQAGNALITALYPLAFHDRERRLAIDAPVCPMLADNLLTVLGWWNKWSADPPLDLRFETKPADFVGAPRQPATAFLSGGVDSFHMLYRNRKLHARGTPAAIERVIVVHGFDVGRRKVDREDLMFSTVHRRITDIAAAAGMPVATCRTNLRHVKHYPGYWFDRYFGAAAIAMGHAILSAPGYLMLAGTHDIENLSPIGSNPAVDVQFSSQRIQIVHEGVRFSRLQKVRELLDWPLAIDNLRVCAQGGRADYNCGVCEKCLRTRLELLAAGCASTKSLGDSAFAAALLDHVDICNDYQAACYRDAARVLRDGIAPALAEAIDARVAAFEASGISQPGT